jgi:ribosomal protein S18 acetylase RimI-like enzyme
MVVTFFRGDFMVRIEQLNSMENYIEGLSELLRLVVDDGASIGFLPPLTVPQAKKYWESVLSPDVILLIAQIDNVVVGSIQLHLCTKENGLHRAEIAKLMTHPNYRRNGIGRLLMQCAEEIAKQENRSTIVLDTREGDPSNLLYHSLGYTLTGRIPNYAKSANGELLATNYYYKLLKEN